MKKFTFLLTFILIFSGYAWSQMVEDYEHIELNWFAAGAQGYMHVVPNPDPVGNTSNYVVEFRRGADGDPWAGFFSRLPEPLDLTEYKYIYVDVWKPVISPVVFKLEPDGADDVEVPSLFPQTKVNEWETLVFDFSDEDGLFEVITFFPDFPETVEHDEDIIIYFDNIRVGNAPDGNGDDPVFADIDFMWCDFEDEFTNVGGFREVINSQTIATDLPDGGIDGSAAIKLEYTVSEDNTFTGYRMWAFPDFIDVSSYNYFVINVKAEEPIEDALVLLRDDVDVNGRSTHTFDIGTQWHQVFLPLEDFEVQSGFDNEANLTILHLIQIQFNYELVSLNSGTVYIDAVGFSTDADGNGRKLSFKEFDGYVVEDFEFIQMNLMINGEEDNSNVRIIPNPDKSDGNPSNYVVQFHRSQHGFSFGGFWSTLPEPVNMDENKYVLVDVWKPRISPIKFKVEAGPGGTFELESIEPQTKVEEWETIVFHFPEAHGDYPTIAFMPDFEDPLELDEDIIIYFDNIRFSSEPTSSKEPVFNTNEIRVFPNPANQVVNVAAEAGSLVGLYSITGSLVEQKIAGQENVTFNVSGLSQGVYLIRVLQNGVPVSKKLLVY